MTLLSQKPITYERMGGGYDDDGVYRPEIPQLLKFKGTVQPMPARENKGFKDIPTGRFDAGRVRVYSDIPLRAGSEGGARGDVVRFNNQRFEVVRDIAHQMGIIPHYKYIAEYIGEVE